MLSQADAFHIFRWSKISLALAVLRVIPNWSKIRPFAIAMPVIFLVFWATLLTTMITTCAIHTQWQSSQAQILICGPGYRITIVSTVRESSAELALDYGSLIWRLFFIPKSGRSC